MIDNTEQPNRQYFNDAQYYSLAMNTRDEVIVAGRGIGKGAIQARRLQSCFHGMPGSMGGFVAPSVKRCLTNILPSMLIHLERWGFKRDLHYVVGRRPWKKLHWKSPIFTPANWENTISFYNGSVCNIISQDRSGTSNSMSLDYLIIDEAKFVDFEQLKDETFQANRGNEMYFKHFPLHHGMTITSDMPVTKKGSWFLSYKDKQDPELVEVIEGIIYQIWKLRAKMAKRPELHERKIPELLEDFNAYYHFHRRHQVIFYYDSTMVGTNWGLHYNDPHKEVIKSLRSMGWAVRDVYLGNPMNHIEKNALINNMFRGRARLQVFINRDNNPDLFISITSAGVYNGKKDKRGEKLAETEEDKLEARTDGSDAFDVLCIGAETKPVFQGSGGTANTYG